MFIKSTLKLFVTVLLIVVLAAAVNALAAGNTVPANNAGDGAGAISGYNVSAVHYVLNATNPGIIDSVTFTVSVAPPGGSTLKIKLVSTGSTWYTCTNVGTAVTCNTTGSPLVADADELTVVIAQ